MIDTVYVKLKKRVTIEPRATVKIKDIAVLYCEDVGLQKQLDELIVYKHEEHDGNRNVIDALDIVKFIKQYNNLITLELVGEQHTLLLIEKKSRPSKPLVFVFCWLVLFFGSGLAIMNFHSDVNMYDTQVRIVELLTGEENRRPLWFQIPYSLGIGLGMLLFFNRTFKKKKSEEPNPLEVEMYLYQENVNGYVVADELKRKRNQ